MELLAALEHPGPGRYRGSTGVGTAFGTFGELMQGRLPGPGGDFLVTLPIARWATATFRADAELDGVIVRPAHKWKSRRLAELVSGDCGGVLTLQSTLPEGKGLASSSADLVATARAVGNALGRNLPPARLERVLAQVEPTDAVLYPGIVAFDHRRVRLLRRLGTLPSLTVVGVDEGGEVDTLAFNRLEKPFTDRDRAEHGRLLDRLSDAVARRDLPAVGAVATRSAEMNQVLRPRRMLDAVRAVCRETGGLGVVAAHSGTVLGVLLDPAAPDHLARLRDTIRACTDVCVPVSVYQTLSFDQ